MLEHNSLKRTKGRLTIHIMCLFCGRNGSSFIIVRCAPTKMNVIVCCRLSAQSHYRHLCHFSRPCECVSVHVQPIIKFYAFYSFSEMMLDFMRRPYDSESLSIHSIWIDGGQIQIMSILFYTSPIHILIMPMPTMQLIKIQLSETPLKIKLIALTVCSWCASRVVRCQFYLMDSSCDRRKKLFDLLLCASFWLRKIHRLHDLLSLNVFRLHWLALPPSTSASQQSTRLSSKSFQALVEEAKYEKKTVRGSSSSASTYLQCFTTVWNFVCSKSNNIIP